MTYGRYGVTRDEVCPWEEWCAQQATSVEHNDGNGRAKTATKHVDFGRLMGEHENVTLWVPGDIIRSGSWMTGENASVGTEANVNVGRPGTRRG